jgi:tRNA (guanine37-N1)-methyltransferase
MRIDVITIFPTYLTPLELSLVGKARAAGFLDLHVHDLRRWATDSHGRVDDAPYGGGAGMVMRADVWGDALDELSRSSGVVSASAADSGSDADIKPRLIVPSPAGTRFDQNLAAELVAEPWLIFACGRYEGIDARFVHDAGRQMPVTELSIGDYVLSGGEAATLVVVEAVARLLPGVVGNPQSLVEESHGPDGLLEYPVYTKPPSWRGLDVPEVLLSGHHGKIARWRRDEALRRTANRRPDLVERLGPAGLNSHDRDVLEEAGFRIPPPPVAD